MSKINSKQFYVSWLDTVSKRKDEMLPIWRSKKEYTSYIIGSEGSVLSEVATSLNLKCYERDYYSIDAIFYEEEDVTPKIKEKSAWFRHITVAFEHEHIFNAGLFQEVSHLLISNSDLKVLVTYPDRDITNEFAYLHEIIIGCKHSEVISEEESFLIILGYENNFEWEGYVFKRDGWVRLNNKKCFEDHKYILEIKSAASIKSDSINKQEVKIVELERLKEIFIQIKEAKSSAVLSQNFELSATIRDHENILLRKITELIVESEKILKYAVAH